MANSFALTWSNSPAFQVFDSVLLESALGEDVLWSFTSADGAIDVTGWTLEFNAAAYANTNPCVQVPDDSFTKGATGAFSFSTLKAKTQNLPPREYYFEILRTDSGFRKLLRYGRWRLGGSPSLFPGVTIPTIVIPPIKGGTGTDLSAAGPGVLVQMTVGANVTDLTGDLANTTAFLRKDLTWGIPGDGLDSLLTKLVALGPATDPAKALLGWDFVGNTWTWLSGGTVPSTSLLLLEDGVSHRLLESGDFRLLEG